MRRWLMMAAAAALLVAMAGSVGAETLYEAYLTPEAVVPASGSTAYGVVSLMVNDAWTAGAYTLTFAGMDGAQTGAAFMVAAPGTNGDTLLELPLGTPLAGMWDLTPAAVSALQASELAVIVYSAAFPGGDIRGNLVETMVSAEANTWSGVKGLFR